MYKDYLTDAEAYLNNGGLINWIGLDKFMERIP